MKTMLVTYTSVLALALATFSPANAAESFPGKSFERGNRIVCQVPVDPMFGDIAGELHSSPGGCAQEVGEYLTNTYGQGFKGGPGQAFKAFGLDNAKQCLDANCGKHARDLQ